MLKQLKISFIMLLAMTLLTGLAYPLIVTGLAQLIFPRQANGSLIEQKGQIVGSDLIGQWFTDPKDFWPRLSATSVVPYNGQASGGSNASVLNESVVQQAQIRLDALAKYGVAAQSVPVDLVTASGSGLDPDISVAAARVQAERVAQARGLTVAQVYTLIDQYTTPRFLGLLGEPHINVLQLNLALDGLK